MKMGYFFIPEKETALVLTCALDIVEAEARG